jgi:hypothetical protein
MSSSTSKNLSTPYVLLSFDVKEIDGSTTSHSCELSYEEFRVSVELFKHYHNQHSI